MRCATHRHCNDWLLKLLPEYGCREAVLVQPEKRSKRIKQRRGSKIARVAVMRRLATIIWQMIKYDRPHQIGGPPDKEKDPTK